MANDDTHALAHDESSPAAEGNIDNYQFQCHYCRDWQEGKPDFDPIGREICSLCFKRCKNCTAKADGYTCKEC